MPTVSVDDIDDPDLRAAMSELVTDIGARLPSDSTSVDVALVSVASTDEMADRVQRVRGRLPATMVVVLVPFSQPRLTWNALACGAAACHSLDQPTERLAAALRDLLGLGHAQSARPGAPR
jgi:hypothetical protein